MFCNSGVKRKGWEETDVGMSVSAKVEVFSDVREYRGRYPHRADRSFLWRALSFFAEKWKESVITVRERSVKPAIWVLLGPCRKAWTKIGNGCQLRCARARGVCAVVCVGW